MGALKKGVRVVASCIKELTLGYGTILARVHVLEMQMDAMTEPKKHKDADDLDSFLKGDELNEQEGGQGRKGAKFCHNFVCQCPDWMPTIEDKKVRFDIHH